jgi:hypothetical protein
VLAIGSRVAGIELFGSSATFANFLPRLIGSYALDAIEEGEDAGATPDLAQARAFLRTLEDAPGERFKALGDGEDVRLSGAQIVGAALAVGGVVGHVAGFPAAISRDGLAWGDQLAIVRNDIQESSPCLQPNS